MRNFVYSTLSRSRHYTGWSRPSEKTMKPEIIWQVLIHGGANIPTSPESERGRFTPKGIRTEISEEQLAQLQQNSVFLKHQEQGYIIVVSSEIDPDIVARDMKEKDASAPLTDKSPAFNQPLTEDIIPVKEEGIMSRVKKAFN